MRTVQKIVAELAAHHRAHAGLLDELAGLLSAPEARPVTAEIPDALDGDVWGLVIGGRVRIDGEVPARDYVFEAYDSEAPAEMNCTLVDVATGDWQIRGINELMSIDEQVDEEGGA